MLSGLSPDRRADGEEMTDDAQRMFINISPRTVLQHGELTLNRLALNGCIEVRIHEHDRDVRLTQLA